MSCVCTTYRLVAHGCKGYIGIAGFFFALHMVGLSGCCIGGYPIFGVHHCEGCRVSREIEPLLGGMRLSVAELCRGAPVVIVVKHNLSVAMYHETKKLCLMAEVVRG